LALNRAAGEYSQAISAANQPCSSFVVHPELKFMKELYDQQDLLWVANAGVVNQNGMTKNNFNAKTKTQLFAHVSMVDFFFTSFQSTAWNRQSINPCHVSQ